MMTVLRVLVLSAVLSVHAGPAAAAPAGAGTLPPELHRAMQALEAKRPAEALALLEAYRPPSEAAAAYHSLYGRTLEGLTRYQEAIDRYRLAFIYAADREMKEAALQRRGEVYFRLAQYDEARTDFAVFLRIFPDSGRKDSVTLSLAHGLFRAGLFREAVAQYDRLADRAEALYGKGNAQQQLGQTTEAAASYAAAQKLDPVYLQTSDETTYLLAENLLAGGKMAEARQLLAFVKDPQFKASAELSLGKIDRAAGRLKAAEQHFRAAAASPERRTRRGGLLALAELLIQDGKTQEARSALGEIARNHPYNKEYDAALLLMARLDREAGAYDDSIRRLKELVFRGSPSREALDQFEGMLREVLSKKEPERLMTLWQSVGRWLLDSSRERFLLEMADALRGSSAEYLRIMSFLSRHGSDAARRESLVALSGWYAEMGNISRAKDCLRRAAVSRPDDAVFRTEARILIAEGAPEAAAGKLMAIKELSRQDIKLFVRVAAAAGKSARLLDRMAAAAKAVGDASSRLRVADIYFDLGRQDEALSFYRLALQQEPDNAWALYRAAALTQGVEADEMLKKIGGSGSPLSRAAQACVKERALSARLVENF